MMAAGIAMCLTSCDEATRLAGQVEGSWQGEPVDMFDGKRLGSVNALQPGINMTCTPKLTFTRTDGTKGGIVEFSAEFVITQGVMSDSASAPVNATVAGTAKARGAWTAKDDDEIDVVMDAAMTKVEVDTASLKLAYAQLTDRPVEELAALKSRIASTVAEPVRTLIAGRVARLREFDDVEVRDGKMSLEIGHSKLRFTKSTY